ncbi:hypothetical protein JHC09_05245 [Devosia sp. MC532]|uniref:hypothetical protein n=1 Tax=Devosia sp. MC532 TaxID=2799788 RepID=UPI0018F4EB5E|nr:hypothetical protein [Devosia sp. MC532]MBJ7577289.1 hypothetical protein [Devosia sp. MC532]
MTIIPGTPLNRSVARDVLVTYDLDKDRRNYKGVTEYIDAHSPRMLAQSCYHIKSYATNAQILRDLCGIGDSGDTFIVADYNPSSEIARKGNNPLFGDIIAQALMNNR